MRISTMEQLDRIPVGGEVLVRGSTWTRSEEGLTQNGITLPLLSFRGFAETGELRSSSGFDTLPVWRSSGGVSWLVVGEDPGGTGYVCIRFDYNNFQRIEILSYAYLERQSTSLDYVPDRQAWEQGTVALLDLVQPSFLGTPLTGDLIDALHSYATEHNDLDPVLAEYGVGRLRRGEIEVVANGTAKVPAEHFVGVEIEEEPVVKWKFTYTVPVTSNITDPCLCIAFDEADYQIRLPQNVEDEEHSFTCTEKDCVNK